LITLAIISGLGLGSMYGLLALGFYITYAVSSTVNFAQGTSMMLGAVLCFTFKIKLGWPMLPSVLIALALCAVWGVAIERTAIGAGKARGLERVAHVDGGALHHSRERRAVHFRQGAAKPAAAVCD
jgi:branched-chain amino acid transport system permease protein